MTYQWWTDPLMLAAGNARALRGGDPDILAVSPTAGAVAGSGPRPDFTADKTPLQLPAGPVGIRRAQIARLATVTDDDLCGDLTRNAARLGVDVADLVALRLAYPPRRGVLRRLFTKDR